MEPLPDYSILDWLKEQLRPPWLWVKRPTPQAEQPDFPILKTAEHTPGTPEVSPARLAAHTSHPAKTGPAVSEVTINTAIPHGTKRLIAVEADEQGNIHIEQGPATAPGTPQTKDERNPVKALEHTMRRLYVSIAGLPILRSGLLLSALAVIPAVIADHRVRTAGAYVSTALAPMLLAGVLFALGTWALHQNGSTILEDLPAKMLFGLSKGSQRTNLALVLAVTAVGLSLWVALDSLNNPSASATWLLTRWAAAILLVCLAAWWVQARPEAAKTRTKTSTWLILGLAAILLLAFGLRIWGLSNIPFTLGGDEGEQGVEILRVLSGDLTNPFITGWYGVPTLSFFFNAPTVALFGNTSFGIRLVWVLVGTASVYVTYLLVKELKGTRLALITAFLVATYHFHIHYSRLGSNQISDTLIVGLTLLFLMRAYLHGKWLNWALAGVMVGIGQYFYAGGRLALVLSLFMIAYLGVRDRLKISRVNQVGLGIFLVALLVSGWPMFSYGIRYPERYNTRANQIGILQNDWLVNEAILLEKSQAEVLVDQFWRATLAFNAYPDRTVWYGLRGPLLDRLGGVLFILGGIAVSIWSLHDRRLAPMVAWWWSAILTGGMLTDTTPSSQRLITTSVPTMFFVAYAIDQGRAALNQKLHKGLGLPAAALVVMLFSLNSVFQYFVAYTPRHIYGGPHAYIGTILAEQINQAPGPKPALYFFGAPRMYAGIGTLRYLVPDVERVDIIDPLDGPFEPESPPTSPELLFVFLPERTDELAWVRETYPEGALSQVYSLANPDFHIYTTYTTR